MSNEEESDDEGLWVDPVESEDEKRHRKISSRFNIVMGIIITGILLYGTCTAREREAEMERMLRNE